MPASITGLTASTLQLGRAVPLPPQMVIGGKSQQISPDEYVFASVQVGVGNAANMRSPAFRVCCHFLSVHWLQKPACAALPDHACLLPPVADLYGCDQHILDGSGEFAQVAVRALLSVL